MKKPNKQFERDLGKQGYARICGIDEVGRGCWAGPIVGAGVIFNQNTRIDGVSDSKKLTAIQRKKLAEKIKAKALAYSIVEISSTEIDVIGIGKANAELIRMIV